MYVRIVNKKHNDERADGIFSFDTDKKTESGRTFSKMQTKIIYIFFSTSLSGNWKVLLVE